MNEGLDSKAGQTDNHYFAFGFSPDFHQDKTVFLAAWEGIHKSLDNATRWEHLNIYNQNMIRGLAISPDYVMDGTVFAAAYGGGIYRTVNRGDSWKSMDTGLSWMFPAAIAVSPAYSRDGIVHAGVWGDLLKSASNGESWQPLGVDGERWFYCKSIAISPNFVNDQTIFAGNGEEAVYSLYKSTDGGSSFIPLTSLARYGITLSMAISPDYANDQTLFAGSNNGIYRTQDGGDHWTHITPAVQIRTLAISPSFQTDEVVFAGTVPFGVFKSNDKGATWIESNNGLEEVDVISDLGISPNYNTDQTIFAATKSRGLFKSVNGGNIWHSSGMEGQFINKIVLSPAFTVDQTIFLGTWNTVYRSVDGGSSWERALKIQRYDDGIEFIQYSDSRNWKRYWDSFATGGGLHYSDFTGGTAELLFYGNSVKWVGEKAPIGGIAAVYLNGSFQTEIDLYASSIEWRKVLFSATNLKSGLHKIAIQVTGAKNPSSTGMFVFVDSFEAGY
jgi:photosystem II stability/assembly factor-like uncharacterized protein